MSDLMPERLRNMGLSTTKEAADLIEQQQARIVELEKREQKQNTKGRRMTKPVDVFIFNCPPRTGKDTYANLLVEHFERSARFEFKAKIFNIALSMLDGIVTKDQFWVRYEHLKEEPWDVIGGLSLRQFMIKISEEYTKPIFGKDVFGQSILGKIIEEQRNGLKYAFISDGGFKEEIMPLVKDPNIKVHILQFTRRVDGGLLTFEHDSRNYVNVQGITHTLENIEENISIPVYLDYLKDVIKGLSS